MINHVIASNMEYVTQAYSKNHRGIDIVRKGSSSDDVIAYDNGTVEIVVSNVQYTNHNTKGNDTYGNYIKIKHPNGKSTLYGHLKYGSIQVSPGQSVTKGQKLATMGNTGNAYGVHLHFEVRNINNVRENPINYLNGKKSFNLETTPKQDEPKKQATAKENAPNTSQKETPKEETKELPQEKPKENTTSEEKINEETSKEKATSKEENEEVTSEENTKEETTPKETKEQELNDADEIKNDAQIEETPKETFTYTSNYETPKIHGLKDNSKKEKKTNKKNISIKKYKSKSQIKLKGYVKYEKVINENTYKGNSLVDGLKSQGLDSSFTSREKLAKTNGINNYSGSSMENIYLLDLLKTNQLKTTT